MKPNIQSTDSTGLSVLLQQPSRINISSPVLGSAIDLRANPLIACSVFIAAHPATPNEQLSAVESARRRLVLDHTSHPVADSLLPSVYVTKGRVSLYVFALGSATEASPSQVALNSLQLDNLERHEMYQFTPDSIYPCSSICAAQLVPCPLCLQHTDAVSPISPSHAASSFQSFPACVLPRHPLRRPFAQFLRAMTEKLVDDITRSSTATGGVSERRLFRCQGGILLSPVSLTGSTNEWNTGWDHYSRPYIHCQLHILLSRTQVLIHPVLRSTPYFPLAASLPLSAGTPIVLLPHGVPAYFLNVYSGPVSGLTRQFEDALVGLGCGDWKTSSYSPSQDATSEPSPTYIIAWLSVQNKQGEEKGLPVIWPMPLAVLQNSTLKSARCLTHIPDLPPQLLASPPAAPVQAPPIRFPLSSLNSPNKPRAASILLESQLSTSPIASYHEHPRHTDTRPFRSSSASSPFADSLRAFRSLSIGRKDIPNVAHDVSVFVASVTQERERERERLKREREGSSSKIPSGPAKQETESWNTFVAKQNDSKSLVLPTPSMLSPATHSAAQEAMDQGVLLHAWSPKLSNSTVDQAMSVDAAPTPEAMETNSSPGVQDVPLATVADNREPAGASTGSFDAFTGFANSWSQPVNEFMDIDASMDNYHFGMDMNMADGNDNETNNLAPDNQFELFTDDDFSFFDAPPSTVRTSAPELPPIPVAAVPGPVDTQQTSGPGHPPYVVHAIPAPSWTGQFAVAVEGLTPRSLPASSPGVVPPELMPSTPAQTPPSPFGPTTPAIALVDHVFHVRRSSTSSQGSQFDALIFAPAHKATDGKYTSGKFALPTPPLDDVEEVWPVVRRPTNTSSLDWKSVYGSATDPRIGIVRRLVGIKRKRLGSEQSGKDSRLSPAWMREHEEWVSNPTQSLEEEDTDPSDSDGETNDEELEVDDLAVASPSRPYTPPVPYLPLGPTLVQTGFHHAYLLPLSGTLRPPGAVLDVASGPMSVPTPVSPAAALGAASERSKALEAVVQLLVTEILENPLWADAWQTNIAVSQASSRAAADVWPADVRYASRILGGVDGLRNALVLEEVCRTDAPNDPLALRELDSPMLSVGKSDAIVQVLPAALRFWEKLGLKPRGGGKDVTAFVLFEGSNEARIDQIYSWLQSLSQTYEAKNLGKHTPGHAVGCARDGLIPVQFDSFKKTLASFVSGLHDLMAMTIFYIVVPAHAVNLTSLLLRQVFSAIRRVKKTHADSPLLFHLIPEPTITKALDDPSMRHQGMEILADAVYDRIPVVAKRMAVRTLTSDVPRTQALFQEPAYTLARPLAKKATFRLEARPSSLDVVDRSSILHIGYRLSSCGKWLLAACIDQRGEMHELKVWLVPGDGAETFIASSVWALALHVAAKANVEWRIVIAKLGLMEEAELEAWHDQLHSVDRDLPPSQVFLLTIDSDRPWNFLVPESVEPQQGQRSPHRVSKGSAGAVFHDASSSTYLVHWAPNLYPLLDIPPRVVPIVSHIPDAEEDAPPTTCIIRPISSSTLITVPAGTDYTSISTLHLHLLHSTRVSPTSTLPLEQATLDDVAQNYHELALLTKCRWKLKTSPILPFHLAALEVMSTALASNESFTD